jgi:FAD-dependent urate hydroxylase
MARQFDSPVTLLIQQQTDPMRVVFVPVQEVETAAYYQDGIVLIGDAAHAFPPLLAQGAAMAIEDAVTLSELLGEGAAMEQVLRSYEAKRRPRTETIRAAVRRRGITSDLLTQHPPVLSDSLKVYDDLIEDPFSAA